MCKVLVVNNEQDIRHRIETALNGLHEIRTACSIEEARIVMRTYDPEVLILDLRLSAESTETDTFLCGFNTNGAIIIIVARGEIDRDKKARLLNCGALYVINEPLHLDELRAMVRRASRFFRANDVLTDVEQQGGKWIKQLQSSRNQLEETRRLLNHGCITTG